MALQNDEEELDDILNAAKNVLGIHTSILSEKKLKNRKKKYNK